MASLGSFQNRLAHYLKGEHGLPGGDSAGSLASPQAAEKSRLGIYRNNIESRLQEALRDTFPVTARLVGDDFFRFSAQQYLRANFPREPLLLGYGSRYPAFLEQFEPASSVPYLADVARLEWLYLEAYHAADGADMPATSQAIAGDPLRPHFSVLAQMPSARLLHSAHPVSRIWEAHGNDHLSDERAIIPTRPEWLLIVRPTIQVDIHRVPEDVFKTLQVLMRTTT